MNKSEIESEISVFRKRLLEAGMDPKKVESELGFIAGTLEYWSDQSDEECAWYLRFFDQVVSTKEKSLNSPPASTS